MHKLGGVKVFVDGQVFRCMTFKVNFTKNAITVFNPDGRNVKYDVRDWHSFAAHAVLVQDVDQYMAEQALSRVPHRVERKLNSEEKIMQNFVDIMEDDDGKIHLILADIAKTEGKDIEKMLDIVGVESGREIVIEQASSSDGRYYEGGDGDDDNVGNVDNEDQGGEKYSIFEEEGDEDSYQGTEEDE